MENFQDKANFIWQVADDILRGAFREEKVDHWTRQNVVGYVRFGKINPILEDLFSKAEETE